MHAAYLNLNVTIVIERLTETMLVSFETLDKELSKVWTSMHTEKKPET